MMLTHSSLEPKVFDFEYRRALYKNSEGLASAHNFWTVVMATIQVLKSNKEGVKHDFVLAAQWSTTA